MFFFRLAGRKMVGATIWLVPNVIATSAGNVPGEIHFNPLDPQIEQIVSGKCHIARKGLITKCRTKSRRGRRSPSTITSILPSLMNGEPSPKYIFKGIIFILPKVWSMGGCPGSITSMCFLWSRFEKKAAWCDEESRLWGATEVEGEAALWWCSAQVLPSFFIFQTINYVIRYSLLKIT